MNRPAGAGAPTPTATGEAAAVPASPVLRPTSTTELQDIVRETRATNTPLRIVGRGTWLDAGRPVRATQAVALDGLTGIVAYTAGDLTLTARAGMTLAEIAAATSAHGQWLALSPWGGDAGSLGATAATATAGPMSGALGTPRDVIIGVEAVTGTGDIIRGGGRVVKNVAGFDLTRLMIGAWGTLGILTEVSVRLRGLPEQETTVALPAPNAGPPLADLLTRLRTAAIAPLALEVLSVKLAEKLGLGAQPVILARFAGNAEAVAAERAVLAGGGDVAEIAGSVWDALRLADDPASAIVRFSGPVTRFAELWKTADRLAEAGAGHAHGSLLRSTARVVLPYDDGSVPAAALELLRLANRDIRIFERLPATLWSALAPSAASDRLSRAVHDAFDPQRLLNPGILGDDRS